MRVLGISAYYHDSAAALVEDGEVRAAAQEERFTRKKHDARFPHHAVRFCLEHCQVRAQDLDYVCFYDKPFLKFERLIETYLAFAPRGFRSFRMAVPLWIREKLFQKALLRAELAKLSPETDWTAKLLFTEHHLSHAASAFFPSPFEEAVILTMDGVGEWATTSAANGRGHHIEIFQEMNFPHSLGLLYSAFTYHTGFKVNSGEYKLMGLAPYGQPRYAQLILDHLVDLKPDGSFRLNLEYFDYCTGLTMTNGKFDRLFGGRARRPDELLRQEHMDLAASVQVVLEEAVLRMTRSLAAETGARNLCLAGGVALNCVANGRILRDGRFRGLWVQPAAGDAGGALGAALAACHMYQDQPRRPHANGDSMKGAYLGPEFAPEEVERRLRALGARFQVLDHDTLIRQSRGDAPPGAGAGLVPGAHGVRSPRPGRALDPGGRALADHAVGIEPQSEVPRVVPAVRALGAARARGGVLRAGLRQPLHAAGGGCAARAPQAHDSGAADAVRHRETERTAQLDSRGDPRGLLRAHPDGAPGNPSSVPRAAVGLPPRHRLPGDRQHQLQRAGRAHRVHARGRLPLLHGHPHGCPGHRAVLLAEGGSGSGAGPRLQVAVRAGLVPCPPDSAPYCGATGAAIQSAGKT